MNDYDRAKEAALGELQEAFESGEFEGDLATAGILNGLEGQARTDKVEEERAIAEDAILQRWYEQCRIADGISDMRELREDSPADDFEVD